ncbi:hypothetical protein BH24PSE2_BH24PSE2_06900 [soil metagenome]
MTNPAPKQSCVAGRRPKVFQDEPHQDLAVLETVLNAMLADPAAFRSGSDIVSRCGITPLRLNSLFRGYMHTSCARYLAALRVQKARELLLDCDATDAGSAVGFTSASRFQQEFGRHTGMSPAAYRALGSNRCFIMHLPDDFLMKYPRQMFARDRDSATERVSGSKLIKAFAVSGQGAYLQMTARGNRLHCEVHARRRVDPPLMRAAHEIAAHSIGLGCDPTAFRRHVERRRALAPLIKGRATLRIPQAADPFEGFAWAVIGQQINLRFAYTLRRALIGLCGAPAGADLMAHPSAERVAALDYGDLTCRKFSRQKAAYLIDGARRIAAGQLDLERLRFLPAVCVENQLREVRGIGLWSANYLMLRALGFADCVPVGDTGLTAALMRFFALDHRPSVIDTHALMRNFARYRSLATYHLWRSLDDLSRT